MLDGVTLAPGGIDGNGIQVGKQFAEITSISAYSFVVTCALLFILKYIPGMHLRVSEEAEILGLDRDQFFDEEIGDWGLFEELERKNLDVTQPPTPPLVASPGPEEEEKAKPWGMEWNKCYERTVSAAGRQSQLGGVLAYSLKSG